MQVFSEIDKLQAEIKDSGSLALVPTMGFLHEGHLALIRNAKDAAQKVIVSVFVNPLQFNNPEDLNKYPRDLEHDKALLSKNEVDYVFIPEENQILKVAKSYNDYKPAFQGYFEAKFRPGHFEGVCAIVRALFEIIRPSFAIFGEKDFQQLRIIERMVEDLKIPVKIIRSPTVRADDGLALSSRNSRLSPADRQKALSLNRALQKAVEEFKRGNTNSAILKNSALLEIEKERVVELEYLGLINESNFEEVLEADKSSRLLVAAYVGGVRLIDNCSISENLHHP
jgi:pantoate--beta-alanine ligase